MIGRVGRLAWAGLELKVPALGNLCLRPKPWKHTDTPYCLWTNLSFPTLRPTFPYDTLPAYPSSPCPSKSVWHPLSIRIQVKPQSPFHSAFPSIPSMLSPVRSICFMYAFRSICNCQHILQERRSYQAMLHPTGETVIDWFLSTD